MPVGCILITAGEDSVGIRRSVSTIRSESPSGGFARRRMTEPKAENQLLVTYLAERDVSCPACHSLRGAPGMNCPECGAALIMPIGSIDLKPGPWMLHRADARRCRA